MPADTSDEEIIADRQKTQPCGRSGSVANVAASESPREPRDAGLGAACAAEAAGAALLALAACLAAPAPPLQRALAAGAAVAMLVQCFDHISGAMMNPAVALAAAVARRVSWRRCAAYCAAQLGGAALAALVLRAAAEPGACAACATAPAAGLSAPRAAALEAALAACLALANCAHWDARTAGLRDSWPLRIGATVAALSLTAGSATGASMNPARSVAPALCGAGWAAQWAYWAGPLAGAGGAALLSALLWRAPPCPPPPAVVV